MGTKTRTIANNLTTGLGVSNMILISSVNSETDVAEIDFTLDNTTYDHYKIVFDQFLQATDDTHLRLYCSTNNGSSYDTTSSNYSWVNMGVSGSSGPYSEHNDQATGYMAFTKGNPGNTSSEGMGFILDVIPNKSGLSNTRGNYFIMTGYREDTGTNYRGFQGHGRYMNSGNDVDKIRLQMSSGDISSYTYSFYGFKA